MCPGLDSPVQKDIDKWRVQCKVFVKVPRCTAYTKRLKEMSLCFLGEDRADGENLSVNFIYLIGCYREDKARLLLKVHSKIMRDNGCILQITVCYWEIIIHIKISQEWICQRSCRTSILKGNHNATEGD